MPRRYRPCRHCGYPIKHIDGAWVVVNTGTPADGLSRCPPNPVAAEVGQHRPAKETR